MFFQILVLYSSVMLVLVPNTFLPLSFVAYYYQRLRVGGALPIRPIKILEWNSRYSVCRMEQYFPIRWTQAITFQALHENTK